MEDKQYPYLGINYINRGATIDESVFYVVLFNSEDYGCVVSVHGDIDGVTFASIGDFAEEHFEFLERGQCVRLNN